ncbi:MAG: glycine cleavage system protein H [Thermoguttaceae bacterium]
MKSVSQWLSSVLSTAGVVALMVAALLLFLVFAVAMRPILMIGFLGLAIAAAIASAFDPRFRAWFEKVGEPEVRYNGLRLATDIDLYPGHSWARILPGGVAVGADDLVQLALGPVDAVELPAVGSRVRQGEPLFSLRHGNRRVALRAPVSGTVVDRNDSLLNSPRAVNEQPFTGGWAVRLRPEHIGDDRQQLLQGSRAKGWFRHEIDRLLATVLSKDGAVASLPDGGELMPDLHEQIDDRTWKSLTETMFAGGGK